MEFCARFPMKLSSGFSGLRLRWNRSAAISTSLPTGFGKSPPHAERQALLKLHYDLADDLARFEHLVGAACLGERQARVDQRADAAGGEMIEQRICRRFANVGPAVEAV